MINLKNNSISLSLGNAFLFYISSTIPLTQFFYNNYCFNIRFFKRQKEYILDFFKVY